MIKVRCGALRRDMLHGVDKFTPKSNCQAISGILMAGALRCLNAIEVTSN